MILTGEEFQRIRAQAESQYPSECCGAVLVRDVPPEERILLPSRNVQDEMHSRDPVRYPRTSREAFLMHKDDFAAIDGLVAKGYRPIFYHSHIDVGVYFSDTDKKMAAPINGEPLYSDAIHVVVSVLAGKVAARAAFAWSPESRDFVAVELAETTA